MNRMYKTLCCIFMIATLVSCTSAPARDKPLENPSAIDGTWKLINVEGKDSLKADVNNPEKMIFIFNSNGDFSIEAQYNDHEFLTVNGQYFNRGNVIVLRSVSRGTEEYKFFIDNGDLILKPVNDYNYDIKIRLNKI